MTDDVAALAFMYLLGVASPYGAAWCRARVQAASIEIRVREPAVVVESTDVVTVFRGRLH
jgi:hypothetical protein